MSASDLPIKQKIRVAADAVLSFINTHIADVGEFQRNLSEREQAKKLLDDFIRIVSEDLEMEQYLRDEREYDEDRVIEAILSETELRRKGAYPTISEHIVESSVPEHKRRILLILVFCRECQRASEIYEHLADLRKCVQTQLIGEYGFDLSEEDEGSKELIDTYREAPLDSHSSRDMFGRATNQLTLTTLFCCSSSSSGLLSKKERRWNPCWRAFSEGVVLP